MIEAERIQLAADLIASEMFKRGQHVNDADALAMARELHRIWQSGAPPKAGLGVIAQHMRERYQE